ncbi:MAG: insulinase family protein [Bacteroidales bacterium]|nr:insulinase family protein [Bacteroidales bacterium]
MDFEQLTLPNGIKVVHRQIPSPVACCCLMVNTGSRDEAHDEHGAAHLVEHMIFKGTSRRRAHHILSRLDNVGGELNAYTSKEETVVHATCLRADYARAMELVADIVLSSVFPERELLKEREVVLDEINSYRDSPSELIYDEFESMVFGTHPLGHNILGTAESVRGLSRDRLMGFVAQRYNTDQMVFCSVADVPARRVLQLAERHLGHAPCNPRTYARARPLSYVPAHQSLDRGTHQAHCVMGAPAYALHSDRRHALFLLNNILGGPGMNSRLGIALRERHGIAYNVEAAYQPYIDTGLCTIYFGTDHHHMRRAQQLVRDELERLQQCPLSPVQLARAKRQLLGQLAIAAESAEALMLSAAKGFLVYDVPEDARETASRIEAVSAQLLMEVAQEVWGQRAMSSITYI